MKAVRTIAFIGLIWGSVGCSYSGFDVLNPYAEDTPIPLGQPNSAALMEEIGGTGSSSEANARRALEVMGEYRKTQHPEPTYPVIKPAEVRLMWVPDHLNKAGDLVPAHYYYLKVQDDRWAVQDAFELYDQLHEGSTGSSSATPWVPGGKK